MNPAAESRSNVQYFALLSNLVVAIACGGQHAPAAPAGSSGIVTSGAAGVRAGASGQIGSKTHATATAGNAGGQSTALNNAGAATSGTRSAAPDASVVDVVDDGWDSGAQPMGATRAAGASGAPAQGSDAGAASANDAAGPTVSLTGQVIEAQAGGNFTPYAGAKVCVLDSAPPVCAMSDASGMIAIKLPANARTGLTLEQDGLFPMFTPITTGTSDIDLGSRTGWSNYGAAVVISQETRATSEAMLGTKFDMTKGQADMIVLSLGGGTVTIVGGSAELKWFRNSAGQTTVTDGPAPPLSVLHGFTNIEPGLVTFRAESNGRPCRWDPMIWAGDQPGTVTVPVRAGWWTRLMEVQCD